MGFKEFLKRVLPFFLTFAFGLLIASFFVSITPNFKFEKRGWGRHRQYHQQMELENQRLREERDMLKRKLAEAERLNTKCNGTGNGTGIAPKGTGVGNGSGNGAGYGNGIGNGSGSGSGSGNGTVYEK